MEQTKGTRNPRPRAVRQGKRRAARRATMSGNGPAAAKAARRRNKEHRFRKRFIDGGMRGQKKHLRKNPGKASGTRIRGDDDSRLVNSDVRRKTLPATESPPHCPTTPHLRRTRGKQGYNEDSVHDEVVRKEPRRQKDDARARMGRPSPDSAVHTKKYGPRPGLQGGFRRRSATLQSL